MSLNFIRQPMFLLLVMAMPCLRLSAQETAATAESVDVSSLVGAGSAVPVTANSTYNYAVPGAAAGAANEVQAINASIPGLPTLPSDGYWIENAPLNEVFQYLARRAGMQYFFNNEINDAQFNLTGHIRLDDPRQQMEDIAVAFGLSIYEQGGTVYVMNEMQLSRLPVEVMSYQLKYLRGATPGRAITQNGGDQGGAGLGVPEFEKIKSIIRPMLTKPAGQIEFEEKTNTLLITDNTVRLRKIRDMLEKLDRPKQQIVVNVRVLRVKKMNGKRVGVDWTAVLGDGLPISAEQSLNALFNLPDTATLTKASSAVQEITRAFNGTGTTGAASLGLPWNVPSIASRSDAYTNGDHSSGGAPMSTTLSTSGFETFTDSMNRQRSYQDGVGLVFQAAQVEAIVHALHQGDVVTQEACPTIITEDNEQGLVSIVDRFPIVTANVVNTAAGQNVTEEIRYKIDDEDPNAMEEPEKSREIGVTLSVTPTLLPDGTVRMKLRPRVAKIVELIPGKSGNVYPRVSESAVEAISRIPNGQSLFLGGFYDYSNGDATSRVPVLGRIPVINKLFSYKEQKMEQVSLVFIITPRVYDASSLPEMAMVNNVVREHSGMDQRVIDGPNGLKMRDGEWEGTRPDGTPSRSLYGARPQVEQLPPLGPDRPTPWLRRVFSAGGGSRESMSPPPGQAPPALPASATDSGLKPSVRITTAARN